MNPDIHAHFTRRAFLGRAANGLGAVALASLALAAPMTAQNGPPIDARARVVPGRSVVHTKNRCLPFIPRTRRSAPSH